MTDRFNSQEEYEWNMEMFMQGFRARREGRELDGVNCPTADQVGEFSRASWRAGWTDADMRLLSERGSPPAEESDK